MSLSAFQDLLKSWPTKPIVIATHPRSGTHLTIDTLRKQFPPCDSWKWPGERLDRLYLSLDSLLTTPPQITDQVAGRILRRADRILIKTHRMPPDALPGTNRSFWLLPESWMQALMDHTQIIHAYRDGRDVMVSYHAFCQRYDPEARCGLGRFIRQTNHGMSHAKMWAHHTRVWDQAPGVVSLKFEDLRRRTREALEALGQQLGMTPLMQEPLIPKPFSGLWASRWARLAGIRPRCTTIIGRGVRTTKKTSWRESLSDQDRDFFHHEAGDRLMELGYEPSSAWTNTDGPPH